MLLDKIIWRLQVPLHLLWYVELEQSTLVD